MKTSNKWVFALFMLAAPLPLLAEQETERHYRVELIVVRHLSGSSDTAPQETLRDLSEVLDLYAPPSDEPEPEKATDAEYPELEAEPEEPLALRIEEMSDTMRETWRRLRGSAGFRPELFRAWEQSGDSPFPELRIHDDEVLFQVDPQSLAAHAPVDEYGALVFSDETIQRGMDSDSDSLLDEEPEPMRYFYRIDGTASLARSRFLHLDLDIELREPLYEPLEPAVSLADEQVELDAETGFKMQDEMQDIQHTGSRLARTGPAAEAEAFRNHRIQQRRQIRTEQMEYFDGPVIGVLAWVTGFDVMPEDIEAVPESVETE